MSYLTTAPELLDSAATDLASVAGTLNTANASAAARTTGLLAAAQDEVSAAIASLLSDHAAAYQAVSVEAATFHQQFMRALTAAAGAYAGAEAAGVAQLGGLLGLFGGPGLPSAANVALIMGGSGIPIPPPDYIANNFNLYIQPFFQNFVPQALFTPAGNYALYTGVKSLTLDVSQAQGVQILDSAILQQLAAGNDVVVKGQSQSSTISSMVMPLLAAQGVPSTAHLSFVLTGDPNNPNGGLFARLAGLRIPALGITFNGATPDNLYTTTIWTQEYDGFADVPRYPINLLSDLNSLAGIYYVHSSYADLSHAQVSSAIQLPTSGPTMTTYNMIPTAHLPLLEPLRSIPLVGTPFADLLEPDLRVLVNLGYGDPNYGWSQGPANVSTPFGLFPSLSDLEKVPPLLSVGTQHGISDFIHDFTSTGSVASSVSSLSVWAPPSVPSATTLANPADLLSALSPVSLANGLSNTINTLSGAASDAYAILLPTADVANGLLTSLPAYDLTLFANGLQSGDLISAIGQPIATDTYLIPLAGAFEAFAVVSQLQTVFDDLGRLIPS